jgi:4-amino-4-deoxy-L-arabinose transferase-like glycosyltransferase
LIYPLDLSGDETYYWDWGRQPDWGYFSKPPLIAWLMAGARAMGWDGAPGLRILSVLLSLGPVALTYGLGRVLFGPQTALWAAALFAMTPAHVVLGLAAIPDLPLSLCWGGALWAFWRWSLAPAPGVGLILVVCLGLGLLAKQTMLAFFPLALFHLASRRDTRQVLYRPAAWLMAAAALAFLIPVLAWNLRHDWVTLDHTGRHFEAAPFGIGSALRNLGELFGGQFLLLGPVTWGLLALWVPRALYRLPTLDRRTHYLVSMGALPLALGAALALHQRVQPNWLLPFLPAALLGVTAWAREPAGAAHRRAWMRRGLVTGTLLMAATWALPFLPLERGVAGHPVDPLHGLRGWAELAGRVQRLRAGVPGWQGAPVLVWGHRHFASQLAFYLPDRPRVGRWPRLPGQVESQYEIWGLPDLTAADQALVVLAGQGIGVPPPAALAAQWARLQPLGEVLQPLGPHRQRVVSLFHARGWQGVPLPLTP